MGQPKYIYIYLSKGEGKKKKEKKEQNCTLALEDDENLRRSIHNVCDAVHTKHDYRIQFHLFRIHCYFRIKFIIFVFESISPISYSNHFV